MESETVEKLDDLGVEFLEQLRNFSGSAIEFIEEQAPELCSEIIMLGRVENSFLVLLGITFFVAGCFLWRHTMKQGKIIQDWNNDITFSQLICVAQGTLSVAGWIAGFTIVLSNIYDLFKVCFAPRVYLIEYISEMVK